MIDVAEIKKQICEREEQAREILFVVIRLGYFKLLPWQANGIAVEVHGPVCFIFNAGTQVLRQREVLGAKGGEITDFLPGTWIESFLEQADSAIKEAERNREAEQERAEHSALLLKATRFGIAVEEESDAA